MKKNKEKIRGKSQILGRSHRMDGGGEVVKTCCAAMFLSFDSFVSG